MNVKERTEEEEPFGPLRELGSRHQGDSGEMSHREPPGGTRGRTSVTLTCYAKHDRR